MDVRKAIADGYRLYWLTVETEIPVFCRADERPDSWTVQRWLRDGYDEFDVAGMRRLTKQDCDESLGACLPYTDLEDEGDDEIPTIGELMDAQEQGQVGQ